MTTLSLLAIGIFLGLLIATLVASTALLAYVAWRIRREAQESAAVTRRAVNLSTIAIDRMRGEVSLALSSMDANRLHDASVTIQHGVKQLQQTVASLGKLVFAAGVSDGNMGLTPDAPAPNYYDGPLTMYDPPTPRENTTPFEIWHLRKKQEEELAKGATTSIPVTSLPDLQQPDGSGLDDASADEYLSQYVERGNPLGDLPGMTEGSDAPVVPRG